MDHGIALVKMQEFAIAPPINVTSLDASRGNQSHGDDAAATVESCSKQRFLALLCNSPVRLAKKLQKFSADGILLFPGVSRISGNLCNPLLSVDLGGYCHCG